MKATINEIEVEGTPEEIAEFIYLSEPQYNIKTTEPIYIKPPRPVPNPTPITSHTLRSSPKKNCDCGACVKLN